MTASAQIDRRIDWFSTLAALVAAYPTGPGGPPGCTAYTTDFGQVCWNGFFWENQTTAAIAGNITITQAAGTPLTAEMCNVSGGAATAVTLPACVPGNNIIVHNISGFNVSVFPNAGGTTTEKINALGANAALVLPTLTSTTFTGAALGQWLTVPRVPS